MYKTLRVLTGDSDNFFFILYPLFILLPHYLRQLPFFRRSIGLYADAIAVIMIACLFLQVGH